MTPGTFKSLMTGRPRVIIATVAAVVALGAAVAGGRYTVWQMTPPELPETMDEALAVIPTGRFDRLPDARKQAYLDKTRKHYEALPEDEQRALRQEIRNTPALREAVSRAMVNQFFQRAEQFARGTPEQRQAVVDMMITMQNMSGSGGKGEKGDGGPEPARRYRENESELTEAERAEQRAIRQREGRARIAEILESGNPQNQAYVAEFMKAIRLRREELGMPAHP